MDKINVYGGKMGNCKLHLINMEKIKDGHFIKNFKLTFLNTNGRQKEYEMISFNELVNPDDIGKTNNGVAIIALYKGKLLLLREFRMAVNDYVYNLVAGRIEPGENIEDCVHREIYEETGLEVSNIVTVLPSTFAAASMTDLRMTFVVAEVTGEISDAFMNEHEEIHGGFYTPEEVKELLQSPNFNANCQLVAYFYSMLSVFTDAFEKAQTE